MPRRPRCRTCGKVLTGPVRGGRIFCGPPCWPSRPRTDPERERLGPLESLSFIDLLALRRTAASRGDSPTEAEVEAEIGRRIEEKR
jgi:hypothetical protein